MKFDDLKVSELTDVVAVFSIAVGLFLAIYFEQKDLALMLGGGLSGIIGTSVKSRS